MMDQPLNLLLVDDEDDFRRTSAKWLSLKGHAVTEVSNAAEALGLLERLTFDVAVFDMNLPGMSGLELLQRVNEGNIDIRVIMLTGQGTVETAVSAMKLGACDFVRKPCLMGDLEFHAYRARERHQLEKENKQLKAVISRARPAAKFVGESESLAHVARLVEKVAPTNKPVLIEGESGTGKELIAQAIQQTSSVADKPFVTINCAAISENLVESELFGHRKGAFTGATAEKPGLFEIADGGTMFIDEIGELPLSLQPKLLRVLEDGSLRRVGCHLQRKVKVRIIAATNRNLQSEVNAGNFREDLFYRINVLTILLPPLRDREGDIDRLINHFLPRPFRVDPDARTVLNEYDWPGNVRQLINVIERATILADDFGITIDDLPTNIAEYVEVKADNCDEQNPSANPRTEALQHKLPVSVIGDSKYTLDDVARDHVLKVLDSENGNKAATARKLGVHRRKLYHLLERYFGGAEKHMSDGFDVDSIL
jgi:DNA-binding NtrC family response regulator